MATSITCKPRGPSSVCSFVMTREAAWQCGHVVKINSSATTLPLYCDSNCWPFPGSSKVNSGALRVCSSASLKMAEQEIAATAMDNNTLFNCECSQKNFS